MWRKVSQGHNRIARVGFEPRLCWPRARRSNHSTMLLIVIVPILKNKNGNHQDCGNYRPIAISTVMHNGVRDAQCHFYQYCKHRLEAHKSLKK